MLVEHPDALIIHANLYRFGAREQLKRSAVFSRMQLWCLSGHGSVCVNNTRFAMHAGSLLILPWQHAISYHPDPNEPFYVAGLHLIPQCQLSAQNQAPWFQTPHHHGHPLADVAWMQDRTICGLEKTRSFQLPLNHSLLKLSDYICDVFSRPDKNELLIRNLSQSVLHEWGLLCASAEPQQKFPNHQHWPQHFQRLCASIQHEPSIQRSLKECAHMAQCSTATLQRYAHSYLQTSLFQWQRQLQLKRAAEYLRSSNKRIAEIAQDCGFEDPLYFSRVFKQQFTMSPRQYRSHYGLV